MKAITNNTFRSDFNNLFMLRNRHSGKRRDVPDGTSRSASRISIVIRDAGQARLAEASAKRASMTKNA